MPNRYSYWALDRMLLEQEAQKANRKASTKTNPDNKSAHSKWWRSLWIMGFGRG